MLENSMIYTMYDTHRSSGLYTNAIAKMCKHYLYHCSPEKDEDDDDSVVHTLSKALIAGYELVERITNYYPKPEFGIKYTHLDSTIVTVKENTVLRKDFCRLIHFAKDTNKKQDKLLLLAPMAGHNATLLRNTVETMLPWYDVYVTDWINARNIPVAKGYFDLDDYINYVIEFMELLAPKLHVMAVCQPSVPALAAVALMSSEKNPALPETLTLIGGPIDTRQSPTQVNSFATEKSLVWFASNLITRVPLRYPGAMRRVYPGFLNLTGFMSMNLNRHIGEHIRLYKNILVGNDEKAGTQEKFYNEYLSVTDMTAEFYLQTIHTVFKDYSLPDGTMISRGRKVDTSAIEKVRLLCIEGERDTISGIGQTKAALDICPNVSTNDKVYLLQKGVGHYGLFSGHKFRTQVAPAIHEFMSKGSHYHT